jgi:hypothetical protein
MPGVQISNLRRVGLDNQDADPRLAMQAAWVIPRYPAPMTVRRIWLSVEDPGTFTDRLRSLPALED